jgi:two-component system sensor histidine kinase MprB
MTIMSACAVGVAVVVVAVTAWWLVHAKLYEQFDVQLHSYAQVAAKADTPTEALQTVRGTAGQGRSDRVPKLIVQFLDQSGHRVAGAGDRISAIPVTATARAVAAGRLPDQSETVHIGSDRYRVWTVHRTGGAAQVAQNSEGTEDTLAVLGLWFAVVALVGVAGAAVIGLFVARAALRPVRELTLGAERVARTQDLRAEISVQGRDEVARLAEAFNAMLTALANSRAAQQRLIQDAGHELRTPLASLRNNIELLLHARAQQNTGKALSAEDQTRLLTDLDLQSIELTSLVAELVDLSKEDPVPESPQQVELTDVVDAAVERGRPRAPHVRFEVASMPVTLWCRPISLQRAVLNLVDNAAKWSPPGGVVTVSVTVTGSHATIAVADQGPGIPAVDLPHVFERFYRSAAARALPGSGLGLAIVDQIAQVHGGTVAATNTTSGGALVSMTFPLWSGRRFLTKRGGTFM